MSEYLGELRAHWRALVSASLGISCGLIIFGYTAGIMGPSLVREFNWPPAWLALIPSFSISGLIIYPLVGRLADTIGARSTAAIGVVVSPLIYFALANMQNFTTYVVVMVIQCIFLLTTTPQVYFRVIVQYFDKARGLALAIAAAGPSALAIFCAPLVNDFVADHGWRAGYLVVSAYTFVMGIAALAIMPTPWRMKARAKQPSARADFGAILRMRTFWILVVSMLLVNLPAMPLLTQMTLILAEVGPTGKAASALISAYAIGNLAGRFISGAALDRFPARIVAFVSLTLSAIGFLVLSMHPESQFLLFGAMVLMGLAYGAETDILGYIVHFFFGTRVYSTVYSMVGASITLASTLGGLTLSLFLTVTGHYWPFLMAASAMVLCGSAILLLLPRHGIDQGAAQADRA